MDTANYCWGLRWLVMFCNADKKQQLLGLEIERRQKSKVRSIHNQAGASLFWKLKRTGGGALGRYTVKKRQPGPGAFEPGRPSQLTLPNCTYGRGKQLLRKPPLTTMNIGSRSTSLTCMQD